jgi:hypothetical protein
MKHIKTQIVALVLAALTLVLVPVSAFAWEYEYIQTWTELNVSSARVVYEASLEYATAEPSLFSLNMDYAFSLGTNHLGMYGATARANGLDFYEICFYESTRAVTEFTDGVRGLVEGTDTPLPSIELVFSGSSGLILDRTSDVTNSAGEATVSVSALQSGVYTLTATNGTQLCSVEMEFASKDSPLPTESRFHSEKFSGPNSMGVPKTDFAAADGNSAVTIELYAFGKKGLPAKGVAYMTTSLGTDFWTGDSAWILADGARLTDLAGSGNSAAFVIPVNNIAVLQFMSTVSANFSIVIGSDEPAAVSGDLYKYALGDETVSSKDVQPVFLGGLDRNRTFRIEPAPAASIMTSPDSGQDEPPVLPLPEIAQIKSADGNVIDFDYSTILPGAVLRDAFVGALLARHPYQLLIYCNDGQWYDVTGTTLREAVRDNRAVIPAA